MNTDFRITTDALDHPKVVKLQRLCGEQGVLCLIRLWGFTARYHPRGVLNKMTDEDIEIASKWNGDPGKFHAALMQLGLLDECLGQYSVHDWEQHNSYAFHSPERSERAKIAAKAKWDAVRNADSNAMGNAGGNPHSNAPSPTPNPSPDPEPSPKSLPPDDGDKKTPAAKKPKSPQRLWFEFFMDEFEAVHGNRPILAKGDSINAQKAYVTVAKVHSDPIIRKVTMWYLRLQDASWAGHKPHLLWKHFDKHLEDMGARKPKQQPKPERRREPFLVEQEKRDADAGDGPPGGWDKFNQGLDEAKATRRVTDD